MEADAFVERCRAVGNSKTRIVRPERLWKQGGGISSKGSATTKSIRRMRTSTKNRIWIRCRMYCILPIDGSSRPHHSTPLTCGCLPRMVMPTVCDAVCVLSNPMDFQHLEDEYGIDKLDGNYNNRYHRQKHNEVKIRLPWCRCL